jgi:hypothetical protein
MGLVDLVSHLLVHVLHLVVLPLALTTDYR